MHRRPTTRATATTAAAAEPTRSNDDDDDDTEEQIEPVTPMDEIWTKIASIEEEVHRRFEEIEHQLDDLKSNSEKSRAYECKDEERFLKLCHAVDYVLERMDYNYDTLACREMILSLLGQKLSRPFSGRTIRNRLLRRRIQRWCLGIVLILFMMACMSLYGLHRNWYYLLVLICVLGSLLSSIGLRRIYKIIEAVW
ncbi:hypothetical protein I4U23_029631 [Adineta vaga]|nr:hypothetical protein I4U23_029631 [Adineta vaga]